MKLTTLTLRQQNLQWSPYLVSLQFFPLLTHLLEARKRMNEQLPFPQNTHTRSHNFSTYLCHLATVSCSVNCFTVAMCLSGGGKCLSTSP